MNEEAILHIPDSRYCFATAPKELVLRLRMAREDEDAEIYLIYAGKYEFATNRKKVKMEIAYSDRLYHFYEVKLQLEDVRFTYVFEIKKGGETYIFSEDGLTTAYCYEEGFYNFFQMPYINRNDVQDVVPWMKTAVFYQIFVDRFYRGNKEKDDSYIDMKWGDAPTPKNFAGGDLRGIIEKLDYLQELGITAIYLTPILKSCSNHKYDIIDYMQIDPQLGSTKDLVELTQKAHARGMRVILDAVFNHCSMEMAQFQDVMKKGKASAYYDWFLIDGDFPDPEAGNYECFASCNYMPKLDTANPKVQDFLMEITHHWMKTADIDGWRLDVSDEVSHAFWRKFRLEVKALKKDCVIIGENWHDAYPYLMGDQFDSIMNYSFTKACLDYFARETFDAAQMAEKLNGNLMRNTEQVNRMMLNLLDSHDTHRFFTEVKKDKDKLLAAIALEMIFPGTPCLYYGTEICMEGGYDPDSRRCFPWEKETWDMTFLANVKALIGLRGEKVIADGAVHITAKNELLCVERMGADGENISLLINMTDHEVKSPEACNGKLLFENHFDGKIIKEKGFAVIKQEKK